MSDLLDLCTSNPTVRDGPCAEVRVGDHVIRYVRRGTGSSVVVVGADTKANGLWKPLVETLAANHRIIVPQLPPADSDGGAWLGEFIEGIGLTSTVLIASGAWASAALELVTSDDSTVRKLILLPSTASVDTSFANEWSIGESAAGRTLWVQPDQSTDHSIGRIQDFIAPDDAS